jgi:hypothetical protein
MELAQTSAPGGGGSSATTTPGDSFAPSDPSLLPTNLTSQIADAVLGTVRDLTQRAGLPQLSKVLMEPRPGAPTSPATSAPETSLATTPTTRPTEPTTTGAPTATTDAPATTTTTTGPVVTPSTTTTSTTTSVATTVPPTDPPTTTTIDPGPPVSVADTLADTGQPVLLCAVVGRITQPFVVPDGVVALDAVTIGTSGTFNADVEISNGSKTLTSQILKARGADATATLAHVKVTPGAPLYVVLSNVRGTADPSVPIRFTTADKIPGDASMENNCPDVSNLTFTVTDLAMRITGFRA